MIDGSPRILIVRLSAIGDVVRVLPALHMLRQAYPDARIDWAVERKSADIISHHPALDSTLIFDRPKGLLAGARRFLAFCGQIRRNHYDIVIDFHGTAKSGLICLLSRAKKRHGFARPRSRELSYLFTNRKTRLSSQRLNRVEENVILCEGVMPRRYGWPNVTIHVPRDIREHVDAFFEETFEGDKLVVVVHPAVDRPEKQWPLEHYAELVDMLLADGRFEVLLTWGPGQQAVARKVLELARRSPTLAPETPSLKEYARLVHRADAYFGGDTGPMHIAAAVGTPVVAVFGGTDPLKHAPYQSPCEILAPASLPGKDLAAAQKALRDISPEDAYDACVRLVTGKKPSA